MDDDAIIKKFEDKVEEGQLKPVKVKILEVDFFHNKIVEFYDDFYYRPVEVFEIECFKVILEQQQFNFQLIYKVMLPYFIYMGLCLYYFLVIIPDGPGNNYVASIVTGTLIIIMTTY